MEVWVYGLLTAVASEASVDVLTASRAGKEGAHQHVQDGHQQYEKQHDLDLWTRMRGGVGGMRYQLKAFLQLV